MLPLLTWCVTPALAGCLCAALTWLMVRSGWNWAVDVPGERSLHSAPTPRSGGLAVMTGVLAAAGLFQIQTGDWLWAATLGAVLLTAVSLADDRHGLPIRARLLTHLAVAALYSAWLLQIGQPVQLGQPGQFGQFGQPGAAVWAGLLTLLVMTIGIAAVTNFFNFMDGANGLAGGMAVSGFTTYAMVAWPLDTTLAALCLALAGAAAGFLPFNLKGRIFMGDGGSVPLGFLAAALGCQGWLAGLWPLWFAPLVFAPFITDAGVTLLRRIARGEKFWQAHREHYFQRLVRMGCSHARLALMEYALMLACAGAACWALRLPMAGQVALFATIALLLATLMRVIDLRWQAFCRARQEP